MRIKVGPAAWGGHLFAVISGVLSLISFRLQDIIWINYRMVSSIHNILVFCDFYATFPESLYLDV